MPTQQQIAAHLDLDQSAVSRLLDRLGASWQKASIDEIRVAYIRQLRGQAAGHKSSDGDDLVKERVLTERVDRELKELTLAEKRGVLINVEQLEPELMNMVSAFRTEILSRDDKIKSDLDALYGIDVDVTILNEYTYSALAQLGRYDPSHREFVAPVGDVNATTGAPDDNGMVASISGNIGEGVSAPGPV